MKNLLFLTTCLITTAVLWLGSAADVCAQNIDTGSIHKTRIIIDTDNFKAPSININIKDAAKYKGKFKAVTGKVYSHKNENSVILLFMGADYPNQLITARFRNNCKPLTATLDGKIISVAGTICVINGKPGIEVYHCEQVYWIK